MRLLLVFLAVIVLAEGHVAYIGLPSLCDVCQKLVGFVKEKLGGKVGDARELATGFCEKKAPFLLRGPCKSLVADKMGAIVNLLGEKADVKGICTKIKLCKN
ncbi:unnamed protein product [Cylicocyclus nassatus]|uniref:Saposin B-type domain-containing protein n=1 Tax=Cylicocyclus nassatus TaxID=53992 RepID=A0AA36GIH3_CYLNA|nr:unnamed protein product [Cylicocyclus nassatus]